ncbi:uncharacterized protein J3R85_001437 [Psidium guajava]|nr:uncharacterized protein J3R85_001437 [Psidium guajava]
MAARLGTLTMLTRAKLERRGGNSRGRWVVLLLLDGDDKLAELRQGWLWHCLTRLGRAMVVLSSAGGCDNELAGLTAAISQLGWSGSGVERCLRWGAAHVASRKPWERRRIR